MKNIKLKAIALVTMLCAGYLVAQEFSEQPSQGEIVYFDDEAGSIEVPQSWTYSLNYPGSKLMMREPVFNKKEKYRRTIQIHRFTGRLYIEQKNAEAFSKRITEVIQDDSASIKNFKTLNHDTLELASGLKAIMMYAEFDVDGTKLMQLHLVTSNTTHHFLTTYTDLAENFPFDSRESPRFDQAWQVLNSLSLENGIGTFFQTYQIEGYAALGVLFFLLYLFFRKSYGSNDDFNLTDDIATSHLPVESSVQDIETEGSSQYVEDESLIESQRSKIFSKKLNRSQNQFGDGEVDFDAQETTEIEYEENNQDSGSEPDPAALTVADSQHFYEADDDEDDNPFALDKSA